MKNILNKLVIAAGLTTMFITVPAYADHNRNDRNDRYDRSPPGHEHRDIAHDRRDDRRDDRNRYDRDRDRDRDRNRNNNRYRDDDRHRHDDRYRRDNDRERVVIRYDDRRNRHGGDDEWALLLALLFEL